MPAFDSAQEDQITREYGPFQVYLLSLGNRLELVLPFLKEWIGKLETLAAVQYKVEQDIKLVRPTLVGLAQETARAIAERLQGWGAHAFAFHEDNENRPRLNPNQYGVTLLDVGNNRDRVNLAVQEILEIDRLQATNLIDSAPKAVLQDVSVNQAIAAHKLLTRAAAKCELISPEPVWMDTSTGHIVQSAGDYVVILQHTGPQILLIGQLVDNLLLQLSEKERRDLLDRAPSILLENVSLETAELSKLTFEEFGATIVIQESQDRQRLGPEIHAKNPNFGRGSYQIVLKDFDRFRKISLIQKIRELIPGIFLTDVAQLLNNVPTVLIEDVDVSSAKIIEEQLLSTGAQVEIELQS